MRTSIAASGFEVCKTSELPAREDGFILFASAKRTKKHAQRAAPTGANFLLVRKFPKGKRIVTFCGVQKVTQKARGASPATPVQIAGRYVVFA